MIFRLLSLKQTKNVDAYLTSSKFMANFKNIRKSGTYKCSDKRFKTWRNYLNKTNKLTVSNGQVCEICREIDWYSVNVIY